MDALNRISPETFNERHIEISNRRKERTGQWILRLPEVQDWRKNPGLLWGYGIRTYYYIKNLLLPALKDILIVALYYSWCRQNFFEVSSLYAIS